MVPTPKTRFSSFHSVWRPHLSFPEGLRVHSTGGGGEVSTFRDLRFSAGSFTLASNRHPFVSGRESCQCAPLSPTRPPVRPSPAGNPSSDTPSNLRLALQPQQPLETESKEEAGSGSVPTRGRRVFPITAPSPEPPRSALPAPLRHLSPRQKGLSADIAGTLPVRGRG